MLLGYNYSQSYSLSEAISCIYCIYVYLVITIIVYDINTHTHMYMYKVGMTAQHHSLPIPTHCKYSTYTVYTCTVYIIGASLSEPHTYVKCGDFVLLYIIMVCHLSLYFRIAANDSGGGGYTSSEWTTSACHNTTMTSRLTEAAVEMILF